MRGRALWALLAVVAFVAGGTALRSTGPRALGSAQPLGTSAGSWFCPHGGGKGWHTELSLVNPGTSPVAARVVQMDAKGSRPARNVTVPAGADVRVAVDSSAAESATEVAYVDGWIGASWISSVAGSDGGLAAEQCEPALSPTWTVPDGTTLRGEGGWVVVMNPTTADAIFGVRLLSEGRTTTPGPWSDLVLRPGRSASFPLSKFQLGKRTVSTTIDAKIGRLAVAGVGVTAGGGVRASAGLTAAARQITLPGGPDSGRTELVVANQGTHRATYRGTLEGAERDQGISQLQGETLAAGQARTYELTTTPGSTIQFTASPRQPVTVARRTFGAQGDEDSTVGASPAGAWAIQGGTVGPTGLWKVSLANPGTVPAVIDLWIVDAKGLVGRAGIQHVTVPAGRTVVLGSDLTQPDPLGAMIAVASSGTFVAMSTSFVPAGKGYAVALGEPIPTRWLPHQPR